VNGNRFLVCVDHKQDVRQTAHFLDTTKRLFQLIALARHLKQLFLGQANSFATQDAFQFA